MEAGLLVRVGHADQQAGAFAVEVEGAAEVDRHRHDRSAGPGSASVTTICRRSGSPAGRRRPSRASGRPTRRRPRRSRCRSRSVPRLVRTARMSLPTASIPVTSQPVTRRAPSRRAAVAYPRTTDSGVQCPSSGEKQAATRPSGARIGDSRTASSTSIIRVGRPSRVLQADVLSLERRRPARRTTAGTGSRPGGGRSPARAAAPNRANASRLRAPSAMFSSSEKCARTPPAALRGRAGTELVPLDAGRHPGRPPRPGGTRCCVPITPPPMITTSALAGARLTAAGSQGLASIVDGVHLRLLQLAGVVPVHATASG